MTSSKGNAIKVNGVTMLGQLRRIVQDVAQEPILNKALSGLVSSVKHALATECCSVYLADY